jgi:putative transcriptional regulator
MIRIRIRLSALLGERRMKQKDLSDRTGISTATINHYYNENIDRISLAHFEAICEVLKCKLDELLVMEYINDDVSAVADLRWERETRRKSVSTRRLENKK